jgi:hypothetical protein
MDCFFNHVPQQSRAAAGTPEPRTFQQTCSCSIIAAFSSSETGGSEIVDT